MNGNHPSPLPNGKKSSKKWPSEKNSHSESKLRTICPEGDLVLVCHVSKFQQDRVGESHYPLRVSSTALRNGNSYFATLLDPSKFQEGIALWETNSVLEKKYRSKEAALQHAKTDELAHIQVELPPAARKLDWLGLMDIFAKILIHMDGNNALKAEDGFLDTLRDKSIPFLASLAVILDRFGAASALRQALRRSNTTTSNISDPGVESKILRRLRSFESENEDRVRQALYLSCNLGDANAMRHTSHKLIIKGSREWSFDAPDGSVAGIERPLWCYLPHGIEEELRFRHQCIVNTIADLQNHLLRAYGAFPAGSHSTSTRRIQCPRAYENSHACDSFHLGEMIRFFSSRTKTIHLESSIANYDALDSDTDENEPDGLSLSAPSTTTSTPPNLILPTSVPAPQSVLTNITSLIASLRQCPEYQIDPNHAGCGIRRRLIPALDCMENFTNSQSSVLGICLPHWKQGTRSWKDKNFRRPLNVSISRLGNVEAVVYSSQPCFCACVPRAEDARAVFSAEERQWNL